MTAPLDPANLSIGPGWIRWAPVGVPEPATIGEGWDPGWKLIGYTKAGSTFSYATSVEPVYPVEALDPSTYVVARREIFVAFDAAEEVADTWYLALQGAHFGTFVGGSWIEPLMEDEAAQRYQIGWESFDGTTRMIFRRVIQVNAIDVARVRTPDYARWPLKFACEATLDGKRPFRILLDATRGPSGDPVIPNVAPSVSITSPATGLSVVAGSIVTVTASAADTDGTIASVSLFANGQIVATDTAAPYSFSWTPASAGSYQLSAVATDDDGASTTSSTVTVTVTAPATTPPTIVVTSPTSGQVLPVGASFAVTATITPSSGTIVATTLSVNGVSYGAASSVVGSTYTWANVAAPSTAGTFTITVGATDSSGTPGSGTTTFVTSTLPTASITSPSPGTSALTSASATFSGNATSSTGSLVRVDLYRDGVLVASQTSGTLSSWSITITHPATAGTYTYTARATDQAGQGPDSNAVAITVGTPSAVGEPTLLTTGPRVSLASVGATLTPTWSGSEVLINVGDDWGSKISANPAGTIFRVKTGIHRRTCQGARPKNGQQFIGEPGAIVSGAVDIGDTGWTLVSGTIYSKTNAAWPAASDGGVGPGAFEAGWEESHWREDLTVDLVPFQRVAGTTPGVGQWSYTGGAGGTIYLNRGAAPTGHSIEVSFLLPNGSTDAISSQSGQGERVVLRNLVFRHYPSSNQNAAIMSLDCGGGIGGGSSYPMVNATGTPTANGYDYTGQTVDGQFTSPTLGGWLIDHCEVSLCHSVGVYAGPGTIVQDTIFDHNGQVGCKGAGRNVIYRRCKIANSNWTHYDTFVEAGGFKGWNVAALLLEDNWFDANRGAHSWIDYVWPGNVIRYNLYTNGIENAVGLEMCEGAEVAFNQVVGNCQRHAGLWPTNPSYTANYITAQIWGYNSRNSWIHDNYVDSSSTGWGGVGFQEQERGGMAPFAQGTGGGTPAGPYAGKRGTCSGSNVEKNSIRIRGGGHGQAVAFRTIVTQDYTPFSNQSMGKLAGWIMGTDTDYGAASNLQPYVLRSDQNWFHLATTGDNAHPLLQSAADPNVADFPFRWDGQYGSQVLVGAAPYSATNPYSVIDSGRRFGSYNQWSRALAPPGVGTGGFGRDTSSSVVYDQAGGSGGGSSTASATISAPANGSTQTAGATLTVSGTAAAGSGSLTRVDVYVDGALAASQTSGTLTAWSVSITVPSSNGTHAITAKATDAVGQGPASSTVNITVTGGGAGGTNVLNDGFETSSFLGAWFDATVVRDTVSPAAGSFDLKITCGANTGWALISNSFGAFPVTAGKTYSASLKARADGAAASSITVRFFWNDGSSGVGPDVGAGGTVAVSGNSGVGAYATISSASNLTPPTGATQAEIRVVGTGNTGDIFRLDDFIVTEH